MIRVVRPNHISVLALSTLLFAAGLTGVKANAASSGTFASTGSLNTARYDHTATLLQNGEVLVAGGLDASGNPLASAELYNTAAGKWITTGSMFESRSEFTATLLRNGNVLVAGGANGAGCMADAELYNPVTGTWTSTGSMTQPRCLHSAVCSLQGKSWLQRGKTVLS